ncbi:MAG: DUF4878 domain-containing protein [Bacteroidales bacterium]|nr:DUF4878 domain-containing protein [Bacteroidales bacterium]
MMKKIVFTLTLSLFAALACSCGNEEGRVEKAAYKYLDAIGNYDFDRAWDYATEETQKSTLTLFRDVIMPTTDMEYVNSNRPAKITISQVSITDDTCAEAFFHESTPIQEQEGSITLRKRDGKWLVHLPIEVPEIFNGPREHEYKYEERDIEHLQVLDRKKPQDTTGKQ